MIAYVKLTLNNEYSFSGIFCVREESLLLFEEDHREFEKTIKGCTLQKYIIELALSRKDLNYGINTGFGALVPENKVLRHPSSVDSIPINLGQEDYVSMGSISALNQLKVFENVETVLGIEFFTAA